MNFCDEEKHLTRCSGPGPQTTYGKGHRGMMLLTPVSTNVDFAPNTDKDSQELMTSRN